MTEQIPGRRRRPLLLTTVFAIAAVAVGYTVWSSRASGDAPATAKAPPPPPAVTVRTLAPEAVRVWSEFSGRLHPVQVAEIRPEVSGRITEVLFEDGQRVAAGDVLFVIDPRPYEAAVARARAALASARANVGFAQDEFQRAAGLIRSNTIAQRTYDERANAMRVAKATVDGAEATLRQAELDLQHAHVRAPIAGRAGRVEITVGNLVQTSPNAPLLTTIVGNETIYADFEVDERTYVQHVRTVAGRREEERRIPVRLLLEGMGRSQLGTIYSFDNRIDVATGTIRARAKFDNRDGSLLPGMFVTVEMADAAEREALLVPERAIGFDQSRKFVLVVDAEGKVGYREVDLGAQIESRRIVRKGLAAGERIVVEGLQHVRPGMTVTARETDPPPTRTAGAAPVSVQ